MGILFLIYPSISLVGLGIILASNILIDVDHYFYYAYKKRDLNFFRVRNSVVRDLKHAMLLPKQERNNIDTGVMLLHGLEGLFILLILGFLFSNYFFFIFIGFGFHLILDMLFDSILIDRIIKISFIKDALYVNKFGVK